MINIHYKHVQILDKYLFTLVLALILMLFYKPVYAQNNDGETIKVNATLVNVPVIVTDKNDHFISNLTINDFTIYADQKKQIPAVFETSNEPLQVIIMLDISESMNKYFKEIRNSAIDFVKVLRPKDQAMIVTFDCTVHVVSDFSSKTEKLISDINTMSTTPSSPSTCIYDCLSEVVEKYFKEDKTRKAIILLTDGDDNFSGRSFSGLRYTLSNSSIVVYGISYVLAGDIASADVINQIVDFTGGKTFNGENNTKKVFSEITKELQNQYQLGFYPDEAEKSEAALHDIKVEVSRPNVKVRARHSYLTK
jgi:Ca-activated chloride channel family protein